MSQFEKSVTNAQAQPKQTLEWLPIKTAPKTGETILLWDSKHKFWVKGYWDEGAEGYEGAWTSFYMKWSGQASHWMPAPTAPEE